MQNQVEAASEKSVVAVVIRNGDAVHASSTMEPPAKKARISQAHVPATLLDSDVIAARAEMCVLTLLRAVYFNSDAWRMMCKAIAVVVCA